MSDRTFLLWIVDDQAENLEMIERSVPLEIDGILRRRPFIDARVFIKEFQALCASPASLPDFILLDFFLGCMYGSEALESVLAALKKAKVPAGQRPVVIAHSSMPAASDEMLEKGADFILPKPGGKPVSMPFAKAFRDAEALAWMRTQRKLQH